MVASADDADELLGVWRLVSAKAHTEGTGEALDLLGADPQGFIVFGSDGRMMTVLTASGRTSPANETEMAAAFLGMAAYTGRFTVEKDRVVTKVDVAWHPAWENTRQIRSFNLEGNQLTLTADLQGHPSYPGQTLRWVLVWTREI